MFEGRSAPLLVDAMAGAARMESVGIAQRLAAIGALDALRAREWAERSLWAGDPWEAVAAEVSAALNISRARASGQLRYARTLRDKLPEVAKVFATGAIDFRMVCTIIARTENVEAEVLARLDVALARHCRKWMKLSGPKLQDRIDLWVAKFDPAAVRIPPQLDEQRYVAIGATSPGMAGLAGYLHATDAAALDQRLDALAATVCEKDPRTKDQRRADATGPLARREAQLPCQCGRDDCPAAAQRSAASDAVIHVLAEQPTLDGVSDKPGYLRGFGVLPAESVRELAATATLKPLRMPAATPDRGYRPSAVTKEFVRWRDLTCRWPGCDAPAEVCDYDHTVPYPHSRTHASTGKLYCRGHHLIKTFYGGPGGWSDRQLPDGTIVLTAPTGHVYRTQPHGGALFSALAEPTAALDLPTAQNPPHPDRDVMMPRRKQTRDQDRQQRINQERRQRTELIAEEERQRQAWLAANYEPPPF